MRPSDILAHAFGALLRIKLRSALTIAGVAIGIAAVVLLVGFGVQAHRNVVEQLSGEQALQTVVVYSSRIEQLQRRMRRGPRPTRDPAAPKTVDIDEAMLVRLKAIPGIAGVYPNVLLQGWVKGEGDGRGQRCTVTGAADAEGASAPPLASGSYFSAPRAREALIGGYLARQLGGDDGVLGKPVTLTYLVSTPTEGNAPQFSSAQESFTVVGVLDRKRQVRSGVTLVAQSFNALVLPMHHALRLHGKALDPALLGEVAEGAPRRPVFLMATAVLSDARPDAVRGARKAIEAEGLLTSHIYDLLERFDTMFLMFNVFLGALGGVALLVASLQIVNTMSMSILERTREIGVMMSVGARRRDVRRLFVAESGLIGLLGASAGLALAWLGGRVIEQVLFHVAFRDQLKAQVTLFGIPGWLLAGALGFGVGISLLAGLVPALRAARVDPVVALRRE